MGNGFRRRNGQLYYEKNGKKKSFREESGLGGKVGVPA